MSYIPPHRRRKVTTTTATTIPARSSSVIPARITTKSNTTKSNTTNKNKNNDVVFFFGDSFIRLFSLVKHDSIRIKAFKGASAKGLGRNGNENRQEIVRIVQRCDAMDRCIFCFGSVDVHLSYYYKKYVQEEGEDIDLQAVAHRYVEFVAGLPTSSQCTIVGIYPSTLEDDIVGQSLCNYGLEMSEEQMEKLYQSGDVEIEKRQERVATFNRALKEHCGKYDIDCEYVDLTQEMMDDATCKVQDEFRDVSEHNIHIVWETTILVWLQKWPWLQELSPPMEIMKSRLKASLREYVRTKPWARQSCQRSITYIENFCP